MPLDANNRILTWQGMSRIRAGKCRPGIKALLEVANRDAQKLAASDLGFALGPRLNAAGRLGRYVRRCGALAVRQHRRSARAGK
ncbi:single-stranded DNA-specific exonuclease [Escherichia coli]|uniref:Single-stranded DNA-specific exonuclease n=1 Tax=Escherichia coli TaxID=562 RepID=A0A377AGC4_ECOLX|nr:single-stranded DNA-specific exonuclease [Escherichia coli]